MIASTLGIFLDISKAFETGDHKLLCHKLQHYGIRTLLFEDQKLSWEPDSIFPVWVPLILL